MRIRFSVPLSHLKHLSVSLFTAGAGEVVGAVVAAVAVEVEEISLEST